MKTVKYLAEENCKVKINGVFYSGDKVIPSDVGEDEIKRLLAAKFIRKITLDEGTGEDAGTENGAGSSEKNGTKKPATAEKKLEQMNKAELLAKAKELEIEADDRLTVAELRQKIIEKQAEKPLDKTREELFEEAAALGLASQITEATTAEEIQKLIDGAQA